MAGFKSCLMAGVSALTMSTASYATTDKAEFYDWLWSTERFSGFLCDIGIQSSSKIGLPACMHSNNIKTHLNMLNDLAGANNGTRASGTSGYRASVDYIKSELEKAGYDVKEQTFQFNAYYPNGDGELSMVNPDPTDYTPGSDFAMLSQTDAGTLKNAPVASVDLMLGPDNTSTSGCEIEDFADFPEGHIALIQRGACSFQQKAENAAASGAVGVVIFNQGNTDDRKEVINATLSSEYSGGIPALFAHYDLGEQWAAIEGLTMSMHVDVVRGMKDTWNLTAETRHGNDDNLIVVGSHLDSVFEGAGVNDNGSGSASILEMAIQMRNAYTKNKVRFAWWGAEESGLIGSTHYVDSLTEEELAKIKLYLNFDMIGSTNYGNFIYDGDGSDFGLEGPAGSKAIEKLFEQYFVKRGEQSEGSEISFRSDYARFFEKDVAFGGLFTGAEGVKTEEQVAKFGGIAGESYDPCYHDVCDGINNISWRAIEVNADAAAYVTIQLAQSTKVVDDEIDSQPEPEPPLMMRANSATNDVSKYDHERWGRYFIK